MGEHDKLAREALRLDETCASACMKAMFCLFDNDWLNWEPQTLWIELNHQKVDVPIGNRSQIMAARSLLTTGRFWYDANAFEATCIAFNNEEPTYMGIEDAPVVYINWAVFEANLIHQEYEKETLEFDREPISYTAVQLYREGFAIAPLTLDMASVELSKLLPKGAKELAATMHKAWADAPRGKALLDAPYPETTEGVQLARLAAVQIYFDKRLQMRERQIAPFKNC
jgi:hypothetical protein